MLHPEHFYHIYNHANGDENLFREERNYYFFLSKVNIYLLPYMKIYAYCLMPNHFHLLVSIRSQHAIAGMFEHSVVYTTLNETEQFEYLYKKISKSVSNLCSSYTQALNKVYGRKGSLFIPNFRSRLVEDDLSFCRLVYYIHYNPVRHGFVSGIGQWKHTSYHALRYDNMTMLEREYVMGLFGGRKGFEDYHVFNA